MEAVEESGRQKPMRRPPEAVAETFRKWRRVIGMEVMQGGLVGHLGDGSPDGLPVLLGSAHGAIFSRISWSSNRQAGQLVELPTPWFAGMPNPFSEF
jgi:hypothetical protein